MSGQGGRASNQVAKTCHTCGTHFTVRPRAAEGPRFCSRGCYAIFQSGKPRAKRDPKVRFMSFVKRVGDCWEWQGSLMPRGYGLFKYKGKTHYAHRASLLILAGQEPPADRVVMHSCDNPRCVNPAHLMLGTQTDNMRDAAAKRRIRNQHSKVAS